MKVQILLLFFAVSFQISAQKNSKLTLDIAEFSKLELMLSANLVLTQGTTQSVEIEGSSEFINDINKEVRNGSWEIYYKTRGRNYNPPEINIYITVSNLNKVAVAGSGKIRSVNTFRTNEMDVEVSGSGQIALIAEVADLDIEVSGSGGVIMDGQTRELDVEISGSGKVNTTKLTAEQVEVAISGSGRAEVHANQQLDASISGSGKVAYTGSPSIQSNVTGSGSVLKI